MNFSKILTLMVRAMLLGCFSYLHMAMASQGGYPQSQDRRQSQSQPFMSGKKRQYKQKMTQNNPCSSPKPSHHRGAQTGHSSQNRQLHSRNNFNKSHSRMPRNSYSSSREDTFSPQESNHRGMSSSKRHQGSSGRRGRSNGTGEAKIQDYFGGIGSQVLAKILQFP